MTDIEEKWYGQMVWILLAQDSFLWGLSRKQQ
jgi:hypothetical protein